MTCRSVELIYRLLLHNEAKRGLRNSLQHHKPTSGFPESAKNNDVLRSTETIREC